MRLFIRKNMEEKIKLSAIINTKNSEEKLCETLESIKDIDEIIVIDEHSSDDTIEIAKEYRAKIIYADKNDLSSAKNQALTEARNEWIFVIEENEIITQKLLREIGNYILVPKKNKNCVAFYQKNFYLNKEIKSALRKDVLRLFRKDCAEFCFDYSFDLKIKCGKIHKIKPSKRAKNTCIIKFIQNDIQKEFSLILDNARYKSKEQKEKSGSVFLRPFFVFLHFYFLKGAIFEGKRGFIYSIKKYFESFITEAELFEKGMKNDL